MCGIAGIFGDSARDTPLLARISRILEHRGPDDEGIWTDPEAGIALVHRRLSIVDLSPAGHEPMHSADGRFVIDFNGEIYNHAELRAALERDGDVPDGGWRGHSDVETFLQAIAVWGLRRALDLSAGMFAFALWDRKERTLSLVRDRFGEKPLYYGWTGGDFLFGSELKAFRAHPRFANPIDRKALALFASRTYVPAPRSIYRGIFKLPPGSILTITPEAAGTPLDGAPGEGEHGGIRLETYWSYREIVQRGLDSPVADEAQALEELEAVLATAIRGQSMADVPVGVFLSGGIDSSTVAAMYQKFGSTPVRTFSIGFEEAGFNEAEDARRVAEHLGTDHHEHFVTVREARDVIPLLPAMYDEPFADSSQIPTFVVSRFAREQVKVALTGDGGDELFAGYTRHFAAPRLWQRLDKVPRPLRAAAASPLARVRSSAWSRLARLYPGRTAPHLGSKLHKAFRVASVGSFDELCSSFLDEWSGEASPVIGASGEAMTRELDVGVPAPEAVRMMYCDGVTYLPDDILCKVDRASMAVSLETRVPFLDHRVAEFAACVPLAMKVDGGHGKAIVRKLLYGMVPQRLVDRPKAGFGVPVGEWIKGPLRDWAEDLLDRSAMRSEGLLDPGIVQQRWRDHLSGRRDSTPALWAILMFQAWLKQQTTIAATAVGIAAEI
jgi:asparagine synthase (glutamine-hydrolysing)